MRSIRHLVFPLLLLFSVQFLTAQHLEQGISVDRLDRYEDFINKEIETGKIPGAAVLIARNGEVVYRKAFGSSDVSSGRIMHPDDLFYIQSMTKPIITTAFMMLYEEGHFQLSDPVHWYLPEIKEVQVLNNPENGLDSEKTALNSDITIEHLLTHTAGFSHGLGSNKFEQELMQALFMDPHSTIADRVNTLFSFPLIGQPGEQWYYSAAPDVLSVLIEKFSGKSTEQFLRERIFEPLEMNNTFYNVPESKSARIVKNHGYQNEGKLGPTEFQPPATGVTVWSGVNGLYSTVDDYFRFCQMLLNGGNYNGKYLLSKKTVEIMTMNQINDLYQDPGTGFGLGFAVVEDLAATENLGSEGLYFWAGAYNTHFYIDPKEEMIALFFTQLQPFNDYYHQKLRQMVYQAMVE